MRKNDLTAKFVRLDESQASASRCRLRLLDESKVPVFFERDASAVLVWCRHATPRAKDLQ